MNNKSSFITVSPQLQPSQDHITMAAPKSPASNKSANADDKKKAISKSEKKKTPIKKLKAATPIVIELPEENEFTCPADGLFPDVNSGCRAYYNCNGGQVHQAKH